MLNIKDALKDFIVNEPNSNVGYLVSDEVLKDEIEKITQERSSEAKDFSKYNMKRIPFIGEFFETVIIQDDEKILDPLIAKSLAKVIQKNRIMVFITDLEVSKITSIYEPLDFTDFTSMQIGEQNIVLLKRWFKW